MGMQFVEDDRKRESAERRVRLQLDFLVPALDSHVLGNLIHLFRFLGMRAAPSIVG